MAKTHSEHLEKNPFPAQRLGGAADSVSHTARFTVGPNGEYDPVAPKMPEIKTVKSLLGAKYTKAMEIAFPDVLPPIYPVGMLLLCQIRSPKKMTAGGLIVPDEAVDAERYRVQTGLVRAMGPSAFKRRDNLAPWPEGAWCNVGDFVRIPMYGGDRIAVPFGDAKDEALFVLIKDGDVTAKIIGDPLAIKTLI